MPWTPPASDAPWTPPASDRAASPGTPTAPTPDQPQKFEPVFEMPIEQSMRHIARDVVPPIANFLAYPPRAIAADIFGLAQGGVPTDDASRKQFYEAREKSLAATKIPETETGEAISGALAVPGQLVGAGIKNAAEAVLGPETAKALGPLATVVADVAPAALAMRSGVREPAALRQGAADAHAAGYTLPPQMVSPELGPVSKLLSALGGKIKTWQDASEHNQAVTNRIAAQELGLPADTVLSPQVYDNVRFRAGQEYRSLTNAIPAVNVDRAYLNDIVGLSGASSQASQMFPSIHRNQGIVDLQRDLLSNPGMSSRVAMENIKKLRFDGNKNMSASHGNPDQWQLGVAQREAANALEDLVERHVAALGRPDLIQRFRDARQTIAKSYDLERATNVATGDVRASTLAGLANRGRPLTGGLATIANAAGAFPKAMQSPSTFGYPESLSIFDMAAGLTSAATGHEGLIGAVLGRPIARHTVLSDWYQRGLQARYPTPPAVKAYIGGTAAIPQASPSDDVLGNFQ